MLQVGATGIEEEEKEEKERIRRRRMLLLLRKLSQINHLITFISPSR
jgi:hypothetical protein